MKKKAAKKNIGNGIIENNSVFIPLIDYVREHQLCYSKVYHASIQGFIKSIRKGNRIYIDINSVRIPKRKTVL